MGKASRSKRERKSNWARTPRTAALTKAKMPTATGNASTFNDDTWLRLTKAITARTVIEADEQLTMDAGFRAPVVYSRACYERHVVWTGSDPTQDETGRAWDVLMLSAIALRYGHNASGQAETGIESVPPGGQVPERGDLRVAWLGDEDDDPMVLVMLGTESVRGINQAADMVSDQVGASHV